MNAWDLDPNSYLSLYLGGARLLRRSRRRLGRLWALLKKWASAQSRPCRICGSRDICPGVDCMECELRGARREVLGHEHYFPGPYVF
ncbi:MAG TPA: hypothetical protein VJN91_08825 [Gammaproteobacteria bacterium]|nr:hypothetical protein [Gammaproteobacteria bacterium]